MPKIAAEYIWLDGVQPTAMLRSKTKVISVPEGPVILASLPEWGFDGSSTNQAPGSSSDRVLKPVHVVPDPIRGGNHVLVMAEVFYPDGQPHETNTRAQLHDTVEKTKQHEPWFGIEQEYTLFADGKPIGWPADGFPGPQGPYYCGVGAERIAGRELVEAHLKACLDAGLMIEGVNAEVMLGQWEFQIGAGDPLRVSDELWIARWLMARLGEEFGINVSFAPKPIMGDWNGTGAHTNFSTASMRAPGGLEHIKMACERLRPKHAEHIAVYGAGNDARLTGLHETCSIHEFRYGESDRGSSIRIPLYTLLHGAGYFEDRRPAANCDPYEVTRILLETVCVETPVAATVNV